MKVRIARQAVKMHNSRVITSWMQLQGCMNKIVRTQREDVARRCDASRCDSKSSDAFSTRSRALNNAPYMCTGLSSQALETLGSFGMRAAAHLRAMIEPHAPTPSSCALSSPTHTQHLTGAPRSCCYARLKSSKTIMNAVPL